MTADEKAIFKLLDDYARNQHRWFLAEMFLNAGETEYILCFRPKISNRDSPGRYACRYLNIEAGAGRAVAKAAALLPSMTQMLDNALTTLADFG